MNDRWREQAQFMRDVGAVHAEWLAFADRNDERLELVKLTLAPQGPAMQRPPGPPNAAPKSPGPAASLQRMHETMFAASSMRPRIPEPPVGSDVPRAVSAKKAAERRGAKASKRNA